MSTGETTNQPLALVTGSEVVAGGGTGDVSNLVLSAPGVAGSAEAEPAAEATLTPQQEAQVDSTAEGVGATATDGASVITTEHTTTGHQEVGAAHEEATKEPVAEEATDGDADNTKADTDGGANLDAAESTTDGDHKVTDETATTAHTEDTGDAVLKVIADTDHQTNDAAIATVLAAPAFTAVQTDAGDHVGGTPIKPLTPLTEAPEGKGGFFTRRRLIAFAAGAVVLAGAVGLAIWAARSGSGDMTGVVAHALPKRVPPVIEEGGALITGGSTAATQYSAEALTISHGEGWLTTIAQVVPGITQEQAASLLKEVGPKLLQIQSNTGEATAYSGAPGGLGINESNGRMVVGALDEIRNAAVAKGWM